MFFSQNYLKFFGSIMVDVDKKLRIIVSLIRFIDTPVILFGKKTISL